MILNASQRGGAIQLAVHLLKPENEHVEVHEIRGFISENVKEAMKEAQAIAKGTRCRQHLFSLSLSPPETEAVSAHIFEAAIEKIEEANGLTGQPRIIIFHEKQGRRHAHCVWSRIDAETMTAKPLPFFKLKLREISKGLYLEHGWRMPRGMVDSREHDPRNFTLGEWQQAKRMGRDPKQLKALMQECWAISDGKPAFEKALQERGLYLAIGDRRAHVAITYEGEAVSVARMVGIKSKEVKARLGEADGLKSVEDIKKHIAELVAPRLDHLMKEAREARTHALQPLEKVRVVMTERHSGEREKVMMRQQLRHDVENQVRAKRFRSGVLGLWDRVTGRRSAIRKENEREALDAVRRDQMQRDALVVEHLKERRRLQREIIAVERRHTSRIAELHRDISRQRLDEKVRPAQARVVARERTTSRDGPSL